MKTQVIIKGALYFDGDKILRPHYSGKYHTVDCTEYKTKDVIRSEYDRKTALRMLENTCIEYDGVQYFECEYGPYLVENWELLSDLSDVQYYDTETSF